MDIDRLSGKCDGISPRAVEKAKEYLRKIQIKLPTSSFPIETPVACLELACRVLDQPCDRKQLISYSGASRSSYLTRLRTLQSILGIDIGGNTTLESLCSKLGCIQMHGHVSTIFTEYLTYIKSPKAPARMKAVDPHRPVFKLAAIYTCSKSSKHGLNIEKLRQELNVSRQEFRSVCASFESVCKSLKLEMTPQDSGKKRRKSPAESPIEIKKKAKQQQTPTPLVNSSKKQKQKSLQKVMQMIDRRDVTPKVLEPIAAPKPVETQVSHDDYLAWKAKLVQKMIG